jgi:hypothetical protein
MLIQLHYNFWIHKFLCFKIKLLFSLFILNSIQNDCEISPLDFQFNTNMSLTLEILYFSVKLGQDNCSETPT